MSAISEILYQGPLITKASKALILLHGRGGTARNILSLADRLVTEEFYVAAPQAANNSWYPYSFMAEEAKNEPWLTASVQAVHKLIKATSYHIPCDHIYILGFSQGACLALETTARYPTKYGGVIAFTGGLIGQEINQNKYQGQFEGTKVFIGNSDNDPHVPLERSQQSHDLMKRLGADVKLQVYEGMGHTINDHEIDWITENILHTK